MGTLFGLISAGFVVTSYVPYARNVYFNKTKPPLSSWIAWFLLDLIFVLNLIALEQVPYQMLAFLSGTCIVLALSIYKGTTLQWERRDTICVLLVMAAVLIWHVSNSAEVGLVLNLFAACVSFEPMLRSIRADPLNEKPLPWSLVFMGSIFQLLASETWGFWEIVTPMTWMVLQGIALFHLLRARVFFL